MKIIKKKYISIVLRVIVILIIIFLYLYKLGDIPAGLFCDEALIGYRSYELINKNLSGFINPFFYNHFQYIYGAVLVYATFPFIKLFGLNDFSVRLASVFFALLSLYVIYITLKTMKARCKVFSVVLFAMTPIFFHLSRINFGHLFSFFFLALGYYFYTKSKPWLSGLSFAASLYGHSSFVLGILALLFSIILSEIIFNKLNLNKYKSIIIILFVFLFFSLPLVKMSLTNPIYLKRLKDKNQNTLTFLSKEKIINIIKNYPKYYSYDFLFSKGEVGMPGSFITRHSIPGSGSFYKVSLPLILLSFAILLTYKQKQNKYYIPFFILFFLYPLPDIITTNINSPPYSFSISPTVIFYPFLISYGLNFLDLAKKYLNIKRLLIILSIIFLVEFIGFYKNYLTYPLKSSDYWGWQYGPKEIISYFLKEKNNYDELFMTGSFNEPDIFLKFYDPKGICSNCFIGSINRYDSNKKQLFALRPEEFNNYPQFKTKIKKIIYYPNNNSAFYIIEVKKS